MKNIFTRKTEIVFYVKLFEANLFLIRKNQRIFELRSCTNDICEVMLDRFFFKDRLKISN